MPNKKEKYFTPIDILFMGGPAHGGPRLVVDLLHYIFRYPAVRTLAVTRSIEAAKNYIINGEINTIFIRIGVLTNVEMESFILEIRHDYPKIPFVIYSDSSEDYLELCRQNARFGHYFHIDESTSNIEELFMSLETWQKNAFQYDVALSFAGEDRAHVDALAKALVEKGIRVFYDRFEESNLWGKNLFEYLAEIYSEKARFCVMLISSAYVEKAWTSHERISVQERVLSHRGEDYLLPVRLDETPVPGLASTIAYLNINAGTKRIVSAIMDKVWVKASREIRRLGFEYP